MSLLDFSNLQMYKYLKDLQISTKNIKDLQILQLLPLMFCNQKLVKGKISLSLKAEQTENSFYLKFANCARKYLLFSPTEIAVVPRLFLVLFRLFIWYMCELLL